MGFAQLVCDILYVFVYYPVQMAKKVYKWIMRVGSSGMMPVPSVEQREMTTREIILQFIAMVVLVAGVAVTIGYLLMMSIDTYISMIFDQF